MRGEDNSCHCDGVTRAQEKDKKFKETRESATLIQTVLEHTRCSGIQFSQRRRKHVVLNRRGTLSDIL